MATVTDVEVANASFPNVRQDLNDILEAIATNFSADAEPTTTYPNQWWYETDTNKLYIRNEDNDAWIHVLTLDQTTDTVSSVQGVSADAISEGNSSVEVIDTGTGYVQINVDGAEVARLDATGLGVGTTSPTDTLHVDGTLKVEGSIGTISTDSQGLTLDLNRAGTTGITNNNGSGVLTFGTATSERMRIDSSGNVAIGTTSTSFSASSSPGFVTNGSRMTFNSETSNIYKIFLNDNEPSGNVGDIIGFGKNTSTVGSITVTSSSTAYNTSSDYRLKENIVDMTGAIDRIKQLKPSQFNFIADPETTVDGFIAHEVQDIVPEAVTGEKDGMRTEEYEVSPALGEIYIPATDDADEQIISSDVELPETLEEGQEWRETTAAVMGEREVPKYQGIDQAKLVPLLTGALQEAIAKIEALEARIEALEA